MTSVADRAPRRTPASGGAPRPRRATRTAHRRRRGSTCSRPSGRWRRRAGRGRSRRCARRAARRRPPRPRPTRRRRRPASSHVAGGVVRAPDDPRVVVRRAAVVPELELLEARRRRTPGRAQPVGGRRCRARRGRRRRRRGSRQLTTSLACAAAYHRGDVEALVLHRGEPAPVNRASHAALHALADRPVLAVHERPRARPRRTGRTPGSAISAGVEQEVADDVVWPGPSGLQRERGDVVGGEAQQQVRVDELALVAHPLVLVEPGERCARRRARRRERPRAVAVRDAVAPSRARPPPCRNDGTRSHSSGWTGPQW